MAEAVSTAHLDQKVAVAQDNALAGTRECRCNDKLLALFNDVDRARVLVADASEHILVSVESKLLVDLIAGVQFVVQVRGLGQQRLNTDHLGVAT